MTRPFYAKLAGDSPSPSPKLTTPIKDLEVEGNILHASFAASNLSIFGNWQKTGDNTFSCGKDRTISFSKDIITSETSESLVILSHGDFFTRYVCQGNTPHYNLTSNNSNGLTTKFCTPKEIVDDMNYSIRQSEDLIEALDGKSIKCGCSIM